VTPGRTVEQQRRSRLLADGPQPLITFYDLATGERVELSHTTIDNWVNKTAALILDAALSEGDVIAIALPTHWQRIIWWLAAWKVGACIAEAPPIHPDAQLLVCSTDLLETMTARNEHSVEIVACSLRPLGLPADIALPANVADYAIDVRRFPDQLSTSLPDSHSLALSTEKGTWSQDDVIANSPKLAESTRILVTDDSDTPEQAHLLAATLSSPHSSIVLVNSAMHHDNAAAQLDAIVAAEQVTQRA